MHPDPGHFDPQRPNDITCTEQFVTALCLLDCIDIDYLTLYYLHLTPLPLYIRLGSKVTEVTRSHAVMRNGKKRPG